MRDYNKDEIYFNDLISKRKEIIQINNSKFIQKSIKDERISNVKKSMLNHYLTIITSKYSRGDNMFTDCVFNYYKNGLEMMVDSWNDQLDVMKLAKNRKVTVLQQYTFSGFLDMLNMLSLGVLLDVSDNSIEQLVKIIDKDKVKDFIFEFLVSSRLKERKSIGRESYTVFFHINERFNDLKIILKETDKKKVEKALKYFLEKKWYNAFKGTPFYDRHKKTNNHSYSGYWCFAVAAIVKIKGLDDSSFRDNEYYPKDLV